MLSLLTGVNTGFSTVFISQLMADPNIKQFSKSEASWIASIPVLFGPIGGFCIGPIMDKVGRRKAIMFANVLPILSWALTYSVTDSIWPLYVARMIGGIAAAMMASVGVYVSEICHPKVRDVMLVMVGAFVSLGTLMTMILGSYVEWHRATLCFAMLAVMSLIGSFFLPESPLWLVSFKPSQQRLNKALLLTRYFNRSQQLYETESQRIKDIYSKTKKSDSIPKKNKNTLKKWIYKNIKLFQDRGVYKPMFILFMIFFFWAFCGVFVVLLYSANVFKAIGSHFGAGFDEFSATIIIGVVKLIMTLFSAFASYKVGRKTLLITSSVGMAVFIIIAAMLQSFSDTKLDFSKQTSGTIIESNPENALNSILTTLSLILFILMGSMAMTNMPWALLNELLPTRARGIGNSIITAYSSLVLFIVLKSSPLILDFVSLSTVFFGFGGVAICSAVYVYFKLPETNGRNFQEIEKYFVKESKTAINVNGINK